MRQMFAQTSQSVFTFICYFFNVVLIIPKRWQSQCLWLKSNQKKKMSSLWKIDNMTQQRQYSGTLCAIMFYNRLQTIKRNFLFKETHCKNEINVSNPRFGLICYTLYLYVYNLYISLFKDYFRWNIW